MLTSRSLYVFQEEGKKQLCARRSVLLADEMGLGKTVQVASAMRELFANGAVRRVLIVCPASVCRNWRREIGLWGGGLPSVLYEGSSRFGMLEGGAKVLIGSYETVTADLSRTTSVGTAFADIGIDLLVLDEAQRIKGPSSKRSLVLSHILAPRRWAVTGTPLENHPRELASILRFLFPNEFADDSSLDDLSEVLRFRDQCMVRRTKDQVSLQLPERMVSYFTVGMTPDQQSEYDQALSRIRSRVLQSSGGRDAMGSLLGGLQQLRRTAAASSIGSSGKLDLIEEEVEELVLENGKVIVFTSFANLVLPLAAERLSRFGVVSFTGSMSAEEKQAAHLRFTEDDSVRVMCAGIQAAGVGITWTVAQQVYHLDLWWNPQVLRQAEDRAHRIGQTKAVTVKRLVAEGTIDEGIVELLNAKEGIFEFVVGDNSEQPEFENLLSLIGLKVGDVSAFSG